jgi:hypothetical protein
MKALALLLALLLAPSATDRVAGHYELVEAREMASEMSLKADGRYDFTMIYGAADFISKGKWRMQADNVILDSDPAAPAFRLASSVASKSNDLRISIKGTNGGPVADIDITLVTPKGEEIGHTDGTGTAIFDAGLNPTAVKMKVPVYEVEAGPYPLAAGLNTFVFELNADAVRDVSFKAEFLRNNGGKLELRHWDKEHPMIYLKKK